MQAAATDKDWTVLLILSIILGSLGVDHFYSGKIGTGILKLITFGGCGIWWLIDVIMIATGSFKDGNELRAGGDRQIHGQRSRELG